MDMTWFTRFSQDEIDRGYFDQMREATIYFQNWFRHDGDHFENMLVTMHKIIIAKGYGGHTTSSTRSPLVSLSSDFRGQNKEAWRPLLKKSWFENVRIDSDYVIRPELRSAQFRDAHWLRIKDNGYELYLPDESRVPDYVAWLEQCMAFLRTGYSLDWLVDYIQTFVVGHPFERVNYSLCMAQVNAILDYYGQPTMYHGYFDFDCFIYDFDRVREIFTGKQEALYE
jgi:hypothetical protein